MKARPLLDAHLWYPDKPHPFVFTDALKAGLNSNLHPLEYHALKEGRGQLGVVSVFDPGGGIKWRLVKPGDWIVGKKFLLHFSDKDFHDHFELVK